ncbi:MAG: Ty1/Copia family ribonuclease HI, partial [Myxococcota bacterium]
THVDDGRTIGHPDLARELDDLIAAKFESKANKGVDFLGFEEELLPDGRLKVHMASTTHKLLALTGYVQAHGSATPLPNGFTPLSAAAPVKGSPSQIQLDFPSVLGVFGWLSNVRPGLKYAHGVLSTVAHPSKALPDAPTQAHHQALRHCLRYLKHTPDRGLIFDSKRPLLPVFWKDASFARDLHHEAHGGLCRSRSAYIGMSCGATIAAASSRQTCTALSTADAELYALMLVVRVALFVRRLYEFFLNATLPPTIIYEDNTTVITQLKTRDLSGKTRHQPIHKGFIIDAIDRGDIVVAFAPTAEMVADFGTKMDAHTFVKLEAYASGYSSVL